MKNKKLLTVILVAIVVALCITAIVLGVIKGNGDDKKNDDTTETIAVSATEKQNNTYTPEPGDIEIDLSDLW